MSKSSFRAGVICAALAYVLWGILPLYWKLLSAIFPLHILAFRILFSLFLVGAILLFRKSTAWLKFYEDKRKRYLMILAAVTVSFNWGLYIWAVNSGHTIEASLGYYINPLVSIILGLCFFREKLNPLQIIAFCVAFAGVLILTVMTGRLPWVSLGLALSFGFYTLFKKAVNLSALESLGVETLVAAPLGLFLLFTPFAAAAGGAAASHAATSAAAGGGVPGFVVPAYLLELPLRTMLLLLLCGAVTSLPLYFFARGAKILPLSTLGFIQFINPTMAFFIGVFIFGESFPPRNFIAFALIWTAAILYVISLNPTRKRQCPDQT